MPTIVDFPTIVKDAVDIFGDLFANEPERRHFAEALVGCQGRGFAEAVQPHSCHPFLLETLIFPWPQKSIALLGQRWSLRPRNPRRTRRL
jgi:hypothetical protein